MSTAEESREHEVRFIYRKGLVLFMKPRKGIRRNVGRKCERYAESATDNITVLKQSHLVLKISYTEATSISCSQGRSARSPTATVCCVIEAVRRFYIYRSYGELHQCTSHMFEAALSIGSGIRQCDFGDADKWKPGRQYETVDLGDISV